MAGISITIDDLTFTLTFTCKDAYMVTTLGCHAGTFGTFSSSVKPVNKNKGWISENAETRKKLQDGDIYRKIMDELVKGASDAWGGWSDGGTIYRRKGHWIISAPWGYNKITDVTPATIGTPEIMDLIYQFCGKEPETYGRCVLSLGTDCAAHSNNSNKPCTRTLIWYPPYVGISQEVLTTRCTNVYTPKTKEPVPDLAQSAREALEKNIWLMVEEPPADLTSRLQTKIERLLVPGPKVLKHIEREKRQRQENMLDLRKQFGRDWNSGRPMRQRA